MIALLSILFAGSALLAAGAIIGSLRAHGAAFLGISDELAACAGTRELRWTIREVRCEAAGAKVLRAEFRRAGLPVRTGLRAAA